MSAVSIAVCNGINPLSYRGVRRGRAVHRHLPDSFAQVEVTETTPGECGEVIEVELDDPGVHVHGL